MTRRTDRIAEAVKRFMGELVQSQLKDPRLKEFITITKVEVTPDLRLAKIFYSVLGNDKAKKTVAHGLKSAKAYMRRQIADALELRYAPDIMFCPDKTFEYSDRIDKILGKIHEEKDKGVHDEKNEESSGRS